MEALAFALMAKEVSGSPCCGSWARDDGADAESGDAVMHVRQIIYLQIQQCHTPTPRFREWPPFQQVAGLFKTSMVQEPAQRCAEHRGGAGAVLRSCKHCMQLCEHPCAHVKTSERCCALQNEHL